MTRKNSAVFADPAHSEPQNCLSRSKLPSMTRGEDSADRSLLQGTPQREQPQREFTRSKGGGKCQGHYTHSSQAQLSGSSHFQVQPNRRIASNLPSALPLPSLIPGSAILQLGNQIFNFSIYITPWHKIYMSPWGLIGRVNIFNFLDVLEPGNPKQG